MLHHLLAWFFVCAVGQNITTELISTTRDPLPSSPSTPSPSNETCSNGSLRVQNSDGDFQCICPPDYTGRLCGEEVVKLPSKCRNDVCKNGGICIQGSDSSSCLCAYNYVGSRCSRVASIFEVTGDVYENGRPLSFDGTPPTLEPDFGKRICRKVQDYIWSGPSHDIAVLFADCEFERVENLTVDGHLTTGVVVLVKFDPGFNSTVLNALALESHITAAARPPANATPGDVHLYRTHANDFDLCAANRHDCSEAAICSSVGSTYTCACRSFIVDSVLDEKFLPGRNCYLRTDYAFLLVTVVLTPFILGSIFLIFWVRKRQFRRFWILPANEQIDSFGLVDTPRFNYSI